MSAPLDGRRQSALNAELRRRAAAVLARGGHDQPLGPILSSILAVAARIEEEVTVRLDKVPEKQANNLYAALGLGRDPARPARMPVTFKLTDSAPADLIARSGTQLLVPTGGKPAIFETETDIALAPGKILSLAAVDLAADKITQPPPGIIDAVLPRAAVPGRASASAAGIGATKLQVNPAVGLAAGQEIAIGLGDDAPHYTILAVENDLVTIAPGLDAGIDVGTPIRQLDHFDPFGGSRNLQQHALYIGHKTLINTPSAIDIVLSDMALPEGVQWGWWGAENDDDPADWQPLDKGDDPSRFTLKKKAGKPAPLKIDGRDSLWLRALLPAPSPGAAPIDNLRLGLSGSGVCRDPRDTRCKSDWSSIDYDAIAVTTPVVPNQPFYPFGREPRLFDSFYVGCSEAFSKAGAEVSLCFKLGGADLGPLALVESGNEVRVFGVGSDGWLYRASLGGSAPATLEQVPLPASLGGMTPLSPRAPIAAVKIGSTVHLAVGAAGSAQFITLPFDSTTLQTDAKWEELKSGSDGGDAPVERLMLVKNGADCVVEGLSGGKLLRWECVSGNWSSAIVARENVSAFIPVKGGPDLALLLPTGPAELMRRQVSAQGPAAETPLGTATLPEFELAAARQPPSGPNPERFHIAGFDEKNAPDTGYELVLLRSDALDKPYKTDCPRAPIAFIGDGRQAVMQLATRIPFRFSAIGEPGENGSHLAKQTDDLDIGERDDIQLGSNLTSEGRRFADGTVFWVVQHADQGILYRRTPVIVLLQPTVMVGSVPPTADLLQQDDSGALHIFQLFSDGQGNALAQALRTGFDLDPNLPVDFYTRTTDEGTARVVAGPLRIQLTNPSPPSGDVTVLVRFGVNPVTAVAAGVWTLTKAAGPDDWDLPSPNNFPGTALRYQIVNVAGQSGQALSLKTGYEIALQPSAVAALNAGVLRFDFGQDPPPMVTAFSGPNGPHQFLSVQPEQLVGDTLLMVPADATWQALAPDQPASPALSWEYWNGNSWWALDSKTTIDGTADLMTSGGMFLVVPADLKEADVGGRKNHWIRARLVNGDYGQARTTVTTTNLPDGKSEQVVNRDLSAVRAPQVITLRVGYCVNEMVPPQIVLTQDNLGFIDQTGANDAGLSFPAFTPLRDYMHPPHVSRFPKPAFDERCDPPCTPHDEPEPCKPLDYGDDDAATAPTADGFVRALLVGFEKPVRGPAISIYADVIPGGSPRTLNAEILIDGQYRPLGLIGDHSHGLSEPGAIVVEMPAAPQQTEMFGAPAHWLRLSPADGGAKWSPRLRGLYLNAADALSVETRTNEAIGSSSGMPNQRFRLAEGQIEAGSLELRVQEPLGMEELAQVDFKPDLAGRPGTWVLWHPVESLDACGPTDRCYTLDAENGVISAGNAHQGAIPPLGAALVAVRYRHVTGKEANGAPAGVPLSLLSPLVGVAKVTALDISAGGIDVETAAHARQRAAAKVRYGDAIVSLADLEDFVTTSFPAPVQVRAWRKGGGVRVVVANGGADPVPLPAQLREIGKALEKVAGFGLSVPGGLDLLAPRPLPIRIAVGLIPDVPEAFAGLVADARALLPALFDPATGGLDGAGWPIGARPEETDIAATLAGFADRAVVTDIAIVRLDRDPPEPLPASLPATALVRLDAGQVVVRLVEDATR